MGTCDQTAFLAVVDEAGFKVDRSLFGDIPDGLSGQTLWDLWDIGTKWGHCVYEGMGLNAAGLLLTLRLPSPPDFSGGLIVGRATGERFSLMSMPLMLVLENGMSVTWDSDLVPAEVEQIIHQIDSLGEERGVLIGGRRLPVEDTPLLGVRVDEDESGFVLLAAYRSLPHADLIYSEFEPRGRFFDLLKDRGRLAKDGQLEGYVQQNTSLLERDDGIFVVKFTYVVDRRGN